MSIPFWLRILRLRATPMQTCVAVVLIFASWPMMWALRQQQATLIVFTFLAGGYFLLVCRQDVSAGLLLTLTTIKPQLVGLVVLWTLLWALLQNRWRFLASFLTSMCLLLLASLWITPRWLPQWLGAMNDYAHYIGGTPALQTIFGRWIGTALMIFIAAASARVLWRLRKCDMESPEFGIAISLCLATTIALLPTFLAMIYNQVLLIPAFLILAYARPASYYPGLARRITLMFIGWGFIATLVAAMGETVGHTSDFWDTFPFQNLLLPVTTVIALITIVASALNSRQSVPTCE